MNGDDLVFCDELGRPIYPQRLTESFARHRKAAGIPVGSLHVLRHTAATIGLSEGCRSTSWQPGSATTRRPSSPRDAHLLPHSDGASTVVAAAISASVVLA